MRPFVAIVAVPLRRLVAQSTSHADRNEPAGKTDDAAEKLRRAKQRAQSLGTPAGNPSVPDHGVACIGSEAQSVFAPAENVSQVSASSASLDGDEWIKTDTTVDIEGWA